MKNKVLLFVLLTSFLLFFVIGVGAQSNIESWNYQNGVLTITGDGYKTDDTWQEHWDQITKVIFQNGVTEISYECFMECPNLEEVEIAGSVKRIEDYAFYGCENLSKVTINEGVESLGSAIFKSTALESVDLPGSINYIDFYEEDGLRYDQKYPFDIKVVINCEKDSYVERFAIHEGFITNPDKYSAAESMTIKDPSGTVVEYDSKIITKNPVLQLTPEVLPSGSQQKLYWYANTHVNYPSYYMANAIGWVDDNGKITFNKEGTIKITVRTRDGSDLVNYFSVTYDPNAEEIIQTPTPVPTGPAANVFSIFRYNDNGTYTDVTKKTIEIDLATGEELTLKAVAPNGAHPAITWKNSSVKNASIYTSGDAAAVEGLKAGTAKITASYKDGKKTVKAMVTVKFAAKVQPGSLFISGSDTVAEKKTVKLTVNFNQSVQPTNNKVTWVSENKKIASVSSSGVVKGLQQGDVKITACSKEQTNVCDSVVIHVKPVTKTVRIVDQDNGQLQIDLGTTGFSYEKTEYKLSAEALSSTGSKKNLSQEFDWKSSNVSVATVENGVVKGIKSGKVTITATAKDGSKKSAKVNIKVVSNLHGKLTVEFISEKQIRKGGAVYPQFILAAVIDQTHQPDNNKVKWTVEDKTLLSVNTKGIVTPKLTNRVANYRGYSSVKACLAAYPNECDSFTFIFHDTDDGFYIDPYFGKDTSAESLLLHDAGGNYYFNTDETGDGLGTETSVDSGSDTSMLTDIGLDENVNNPEISDTDGNENIGSEETDPQFRKNDEHEEAETTVPHFATNETWMTVGESLILDVLDADEETVIVGLDGDTDAVLWNEELHMLTAVGEAEVTAFLSTIDPVEVKDMMTIHIVSEVSEENEVSDEEGEEESLITEDTAEGMVENDDPAEGETSDMTEPEEGTVYVETAEPVTTEETDIAITNSDDNDDSMPEAAEPVEVIIRDMGENEALTGELNGAVVIDRDRFELDDETLKGLVFEIENEAIAKLTVQTDEEMLVNGIEIQLLAEGETKLLIKQEGEAEALREIRLVVTSAAPAFEPEPEETAETVYSEPESVPESENETDEEQSIMDPGAETIAENGMWLEPAADEPEPESEPVIE